MGFNSGFKGLTQVAVNNNHAFLFITLSSQNTLCEAIRKDAMHRYPDMYMKQTRKHLIPVNWVSSGSRNVADTDPMTERIILAERRPHVNRSEILTIHTPNMSRETKKKLESGKFYN